MESDDLLTIIILILLFYIWQKDYLEQLKQAKYSSNDRQKLQALGYDEHINRRKNKGESKKEIVMIKEKKRVTPKPLESRMQTEVAEDKQVGNKTNRSSLPDQAARDAEPSLRKEKRESKSRSPSQKDDEEMAEEKVKEIIREPERHPTADDAKAAKHKEQHELAENQRDTQPILAEPVKIRTVITETQTENDKKRPSESPTADEVVNLKKEDKSKIKVATLPAMGDESGVDIALRKLEKKKADIRKGDQGVGINLGEADKVKKRKADVQQENAAAAADLVALRKRKPEAAAASLQPEVTSVDILKDSSELKDKTSEKKQTSEPLSRAERKEKQAKEKGEKKAVALPTQTEERQIDIEARKLEKQVVELKKEEQGVDINLAEGNKRRKQEAAAEKDSAAVGADLVALKRRTPLAAIGVSHSALVDVNIPDHSAEPKSKLKKKKRPSVPSDKAEEHEKPKIKSKKDVGALPAESEEAGIDIEARKLEKRVADAKKEEQGVDINLAEGNKRRKQEAAADKDSAAVGADLVALKRRTPLAAIGASHSALVDVNIPDHSAEPKSKLKKKKKRPSVPSDKAEEYEKPKIKSKKDVGALPAESEEAGVDIEARKLEKRVADAKKEEQGVDINLAEGNKRRKQEAAADKDSAAVGADLVALKRRTPLAAIGASHSALVDVNIPDHSAEPKSKLKKKKKQLSVPSDTGQEHEKPKIKSKKDVGTLPAESEAAGVDIEARKLEKQVADAKKEEQGVDINLGEGNKRRKQEAAADKDSAAVGADLVALKRRTPLAAIGASHSALVDVNIPDHSAEPKSKLKKKKKRPSVPSDKAEEHEKPKIKSKKDVGALPAESEEAGVDIEARKLEKRVADAKKEEQGVDINLAEGNKRRKQEAAADKDSAAVGADLVALKRRTPLAAIGASHSALVDVNIPDHSAEPKSKLKKKKKQLSVPSDTGQEHEKPKIKSKKDVGTLPAESEAAGVDIEARKLEKQVADAKKEEQGVDINLGEGNKRRKQEAAADKDSAAVGADLVALKRRTPLAAIGASHSALVDVNIPDHSAEPKSKLKKKKKRPSVPSDKAEEHEKPKIKSKKDVGALPAESEEAGVDIEARKLEKRVADAKKEEQGVDINLAEGNKRRKQEAAADKDSAAVGADLVALKRRTPLAAIGASHSALVDVNIPDHSAEPKSKLKKKKKQLSVPSDTGQEHEKPKIKSKKDVGTLPAESEAAGVDIEARKLEKQVADAKKEEQGVDINLGEGNKRRKQEAAADKDSAAVGADLVALKRRTPLAAIGVSHSALVDVNIPDRSAEPKSKLKKKKKQLSVPSDTGQEHEKPKIKSKKDVGTLPAESEAAGVDIEARKLEKQVADAKKEEQGVDINLGEGNKRRKQEAAAEKDSAAVGAELVALKRRNPVAAAGVMQSEAVEVNLPGDSAYKSGNRYEQEQVKTAPLDAPEGGLDGVRSRSLNALDDNDKSRSRRGHSVKKTRRQNASADKDDIALNADLVALVRRSPGSGRSSGAQAVGVDLADDDGESKNAAKKGAKKRAKKRKSSKGKEVITAELADKVGDDAQRISKKRKKSQEKQEIGGIKNDVGLPGSIPQASRKKKKKGALQHATSKKKVKGTISPLTGKQAPPIPDNEQAELNKDEGKLKPAFAKGKEPQDQPNIGLDETPKEKPRKSKKKLKGKKSEKGAKDNGKGLEPQKQEAADDVKVDADQKGRQKGSKNQRKKKVKKKTATTPPPSGNEGLPGSVPNAVEAEAGKSPQIKKQGPAALNVEKNLSKPKKPKKKKGTSKIGGKVGQEGDLSKPLVEAAKVNVGDHGVKAEKRAKGVQNKGIRQNKTKKKKGAGKEAKKA